MNIRIMAEKTLTIACLVTVVATGRAQETTDGATNGIASPPVATVNESSSDTGSITLGASFGDDLHVYHLDLMIPMLQSTQSSLFLNPRGVLLEDEEQELNLGFVGRYFNDQHAIILGVNTYYDARQTEADNTFQQVGGGLEFLSPWFDARINYYYPVTDAKTWKTTQGCTPGIMRQVTEEALEGFDAEIGVWLPYLARYAPTAVYVGYYDFNADVGTEDIDGFKARLECRPHPNLTLDAEWFEDSAYRRSEYVVGVRLHVPLDFWNGTRMHGGADRVLPFAARMDEAVQRDFRVRITKSCYLLEPQYVSPPKKKNRQPEAESEPVCYSYPSLDDNGDVIIITVCE